MRYPIYNEVVILKVNFNINEVLYLKGSVLLVDAIGYEVASKLVEADIACYDVLD